MDSISQKRIIIRVSVRNIIITLAVALFTLAAGLLAHSMAMVSEGIHAGMDVLSTCVVMIGAGMSCKRADADHPYGHERLEYIVVILLSFFLLITGIGVGYEGGRRILAAQRPETPGALALLAAATSIAAKFFMSVSTHRIGVRSGSAALRADAAHQRSDALSSIGALLAVGGAMVGFPILDTLAALAISFFILKMAYENFRDAVRRLSDCACEEEVVQGMCQTVLSHERVRRLDSIKTRLFGNRVYVDVEIGADGALSLYEAHEIAHEVHDMIEGQYRTVKHCTVHVNPMTQADSCLEREGISDASVRLAAEKCLLPHEPSVSSPEEYAVPSTDPDLQAGAPLF